MFQNFEIYIFEEKSKSLQTLNVFMIFLEVMENSYFLQNLSIWCQFDNFSKSVNLESKIKVEILSF